MNTILTVIKKEIIDTLRDRRTLISAIVLPTVLIPLILYGFTKLSQTIIKKEQEKKLTVAFLNPQDEFTARLDTAKYEVVGGMTMETGRDAILAEDLDVMIGFGDDYVQTVGGNGSALVNMWYKSTNLAVKNRIRGIFDDYEEEILDSRIVDLDISKATLDPIDLKTWDIAPKKEQIGKMAGGFLPYFFIIFCFMGCMYPGLDLITGEKERGTIETLLTVPSSRFKILFGKVITIALVGIAASGLTITGLIVALKLIPEIPDEFMEALENMVSFKSVMMLMAMIIPLSLFFAGMISALSIRAKSFKEAQSIVTPLSFLAIMPAAIGMMPGIELNWTTASIPIMNIALATKEIVAGTINMGHYALIVVSLIVLAILAVVFSFNQFSKEGMVVN